MEKVLDFIQFGGLGGNHGYLTSQESALAASEEAIDYYNAAETLDGQWFPFIGGPDGKIVGHSDISMIGGDTLALFRSETLHVTEAGSWVESESLRVWVAGYEGYVFSSGWSRDE